MSEPFATYPDDPVDPVDDPSKKKPGNGIPLTSAIGVAALLIGLLAGNAIGNAPVANLESKLSYEKTRVESLVAQSETDKSTVEAKITAAEEASSQKEAELATKSKELDIREEEIDIQESEARELQESFEAEVAAREKSNISDGLHEIGVDVKPGKYKTSGPDGSNPAGCYYAWKTSFGSDADIIDNELTNGKATVILKKDQFFEVKSCNEFVKQ